MIYVRLFGAGRIGDNDSPALRPGGAPPAAALSLAIAMSLRRIGDELRTLLRDQGREDLAERAFDRVAYTDDGATVYVHVFAKPTWTPVRRGRAYVLAFADHAELCSLASFRELNREASLQLADEVSDIIRWFDGA